MYSFVSHSVSRYVCISSFQSERRRIIAKRGLRARANVHGEVERRAFNVYRFETERLRVRALSRSFKFSLYTIVKLVALTTQLYTRNDCTFVSRPLFIVLYYYLVIKYSIYIIFLSTLLKNI